jgi:hypothetical protein
MDEARLGRLIEGLVGHDLATGLVREFVKVRQDSATKTLERASPGKFVEKFSAMLAADDNWRARRKAERG